MVENAENQEKFLKNQPNGNLENIENGINPKPEPHSIKSNEIISEHQNEIQNTELEPCLDTLDIKKQNKHSKSNRYREYFENYVTDIQKRSGLSRRGVFFVAFLVIFAFSLVIAVICLALTWPTIPHKFQYPVCHEPACLRASAQVTENLNPSVSPCHDLWGAFCSGWGSNITRPADLSVWNQKQRIMKLDLVKLRNLITTLPLPLHTGTVEWKLKYLYEACMDVDSLNQEEARSLKSVISELVLLLVANSYGEPDIGYDYRLPQIPQSLQPHQQRHQQKEDQHFNLNVPQQNNHGGHQVEVEVIQPVPQVAEYHESQVLSSPSEFQNQHFNPQLALSSINQQPIPFQPQSPQYLPPNSPPQSHLHPLPQVPQQQSEIPRPSLEYQSPPLHHTINNQPQLPPIHPQIPFPLPELPHPTPQYLPPQHTRQQITQTQSQNILPNINIQTQQSEQPFGSTFKGFDGILNNQQVGFQNEQSQNFPGSPVKQLFQPSRQYLTPQPSVGQSNLPSLPNQQSNQPSRQYLTPQIQVQANVQRQIKNLPQFPIQSSVQNSQQYLPPQQSGQSQVFVNSFENGIQSLPQGLSQLPNQQRFEPSRQYLSPQSQNQLRGNSGVHGSASQTQNNLQPHIDLRFQPEDHQQSSVSSSVNTFKTQNPSQFVQPDFNAQSSTASKNFQQVFANTQQSPFNVQGFPSLNGAAQAQHQPFNVQESFPLNQPGLSSSGGGEIALPNSVLSQNEFSSALNTLNSLQSKATLLSSSASNDQDQIVKHIYLHGAPDDISGPSVNLPKKKSYNIVFIKAPNAQTNQQIAQQETEEKTIVYVLVNKPEDGVLSAKQALKKPNKPEVYFVKYKASNNGQAVVASSNIQEESSGYPEIVANSAAGANSDGIQLRSEGASGVLRVGDLLPPIVKKKK